MRDDLRHAAARRKRRPGFTLLELLVVVAIIGLLMGLILAGVGAVKEGAKRSRARLEAQSILGALESYRTEFGQWPAQTSKNSGKDAIYATVDELRPVYMALTNNARRRVFIEIPQGSQSREGVYLDPWDRPYAVIVDQDGNDNCSGISLTLADPPANLGPTNFLKKAAVFSWGSKPQRSTRWVYTWPDIEK